MKMRICKRPFLYAAFACVGCSLSVILGNFYIIAAMIAVIVFCLLFALFYLKGTVDFLPAVLICFCSVCVLVSSAFASFYFIKPADKLDGLKISCECTVTAKISDSVYSVKCDELLRDVKFSLVCDNNSLEAGDIVTIDGTVNKLSGEYRFHEISKGVYATIYANDAEIVGKEEGIISFFHNIGKYISNSLSEFLTDEPAAFVKALILGNKEDLSYLRSFNIRTSGVSHLVVVSGMHFGIICGSAFKLLRFFKLPTRVSCIITSVLVFFVMGICGLGFSVLRSVLVYFILLIGKFFGLVADSLNSLSAAVCAILMFSPYCLANVSFLLSVSATFGLIVLAPMIVNLFNFSKIKNRLLRAITTSFVNGVSIAFAAAVTTMPISIRFFESLSLVSVITNILLTYAVTVMICLAVVGIIFTLIPTEIFACAIFKIVELLCVYSLAVIDALGGKMFLNVNSNLWVAALFIVIYIFTLLSYFNDVKESNKLKSEEESK